MIINFFGVLGLGGNWFLTLVQVRTLLETWTLLSQYLLAPAVAPEEALAAARAQELPRAQVVGSSFNDVRVSAVRAAAGFSMLRAQGSSVVGLAG